MPEYRLIITFDANDQFDACDTAGYIVQELPREDWNKAELQNVKEIATIPAGTTLRSYPDA